MAAARRAKHKVVLGDVFKINLSNGVGYFQCVYVGPDRKAHLDIMRALPGVYTGGESISRIIRKKELFFFQHPTDYSVGKWVEYIGNYPVPFFSRTPQFMRSGERLADGTKYWWIVNLYTLHRKKVPILTSKEKKLSQYGSISISDLVERIETGWKPVNWDFAVAD